jgi:glycine/D-amino acid oxidase-like deaminating enzyme
MMTSDRAADVLIVGGGVIGCAIARRAARDGEDERVNPLLGKRQAPSRLAALAERGFNCS